MMVSPDGKTVVTKGKSAPEAGFVLNIWYVAAGDPNGEYTIVVKLNGGRESTIKFQLYTPEPDAIDPPAASTI